MKIKINLDSEVCPSCGGKKRRGDVVCFYCYYRGRNGVVKMFILMCLEELDRRVTIAELVEYMNSHKINNGRRTFTHGSVAERLRNLAHKKHRLVKVSTLKKQRGRPVNLYIINGRRGRRLLEAYLSNWDDGLTINVHKTGFEAKVHSGKWKECGRGIRFKLKKGEYERFYFIFPEGLKNNLKFHE